MLAKSKFNSIEALISQEEFVIIFKEKDKYEKMKDNLRSENEKYVSNDASCKVTYKIIRLRSTCQRH